MKTSPPAVPHIAAISLYPVRMMKHTYLCCKITAQLMYFSTVRLDLSSFFFFFFLLVCKSASLRLVLDSLNFTVVDRECSRSLDRSGRCFLCTFNGSDSAFIQNCTSLEYHRFMWPVVREFSHSVRCWEVSLYNNANVIQHSCFYISSYNKDNMYNT